MVDNYSNLHNQPRCEAHSKRTGKQCRQPKMRDKRVCRFHGGKSTGPKTKEGRERIRQAHFIHGRYSKKTEETTREIQLVRERQDYIRLTMQAAELQIAQFTAMKPYLDAYKRVEHQEEFELINFFLFGRLNEQLRVNPVLRRLFVEFFELLYQDNGMNAFTALLSLFEDALRNRVGLSASQWHSLLPDLKQDAYIDSLIRQWLTIQKERSQSA